MTAKHSNFYYHFAVGTCLLSAITTISLLIIVPMLCSRASWDRDLIAIKSERFRTDMNRLWAQMRGEAGIGASTNGPDAAIYFTRVKKSPWDKHVCSECNQLACPIGMPGAPGPNGIDGDSGSSGLTGKAGEDGYDVELEPQDDLPCVICPAGPPGLRGMQGERGISGPQGPRGDQGDDGKPGNPGSIGPPGKVGPIGQKGGSGPNGDAGDTIVAGVGIRGPNGPPGVPGPKGPIGRPGKSSREAGPSGAPGPIGPIGAPGTIGRFGDDGENGPPGEHGQPAAYCHSDCGVSQILAPSVSEMMMSDVHSMSDGSAGYTNSEAKHETSGASDGYNQDVHPIHSVGTSGAYSGYYNAAATQA